MHIKFQPENLYVRGHLGHIAVNESVILKLILKK